MKIWITMKFQYKIFAFIKATRANDSKFVNFKNIQNDNSICIEKSHEN